MTEDFSDEQNYLRKHQLAVYFEDCIRSLLDARRRGPSPFSANKFDVNVHLKDYFTQVKRESHVVGREFSFIQSTPHNRRSFLTHIWSKCESSMPPPTTLKEMHALMLTICPDLPYSLIESSANLIEDNELSLSIDYLTFLRAFQVRFLYEEFIHESQQLFRTFSHRLTCHVPTAEITIPQQDNHDQRQTIYQAFQKLISTNTCICPPLNILDEALISTEQHQQQQFNHQKFLIHLAKNEKLTRFIGKEPINLKQQPRLIQQRPVIEPIASIQTESKSLLASLSTPSTRISSPIVQTNLLPPLPKQQVLVREKPIRQGSPATSFIPPPSSAKSTRNSIANLIKQEISETDSDVESRSSDTDT